ncbi:MAG: SDR family oxidoreductase [Solirubrobacterales bacterium]
MDLGIEGRRALVMGASRGIGRGIAAALAREGARVAISSRSEEALTEAGEAITEQVGEAGAQSPEVGVFPADTADLDRISKLPGEVAAELGPIEILVLNTGGPPPGAALDNTPEEWEEAFRSLVMAPRMLIEAVLPGMRERGWGRIANVSSSSIREPIPGLTLSNANRMAALGLLDTLASEVAGDGVTVNTVATGMIATDRLRSMHGSLDEAERAARERVPAGRLGTPEEYGDLVAFLCSERAAYLTGAVIPLDGGLLRSV